MTRVVLELGSRAKLHQEVIAGKSDTLSESGTRTSKEWTREAKDQNGQEALSTQMEALREGLSLIQSVSPAVAAAAAQEIFMSPRRRIAKPDHWRQSRPPELFEVVVGYKKVQAYSWGSPPWVLLAHGWDSNAASMSWFVDPILTEGFGVVAFDAPAHGASEGNLTTVRGFAQACAALCKKFGSFESIVSHSIAGPAAVMALKNFPEMRPRLALLSAPSHADTVVTHFSSVFGLNAEADLNLRLRLSNEVGQPIEHITFERMREVIKNKVLLVHDGGDAVVPITQAKETLRVLPNARFIETIGLGHNKILFDDSVVKSVTEFIAETPCKL